MIDFKSYYENTTFVDQILNEFNQQIAAPKQKPWSAKKDEVINYWKNLKPNLPIIMQPLMNNQVGHNSTYGEDGIRITGSYQFIVSVLSKIKEILNYENPHTKLRLVFRGLAPDESKKPSFAFYVNVENRSNKRKLKNL